MSLYAFKLNFLKKVKSSRLKFCIYEALNLLKLDNAALKAVTLSSLLKSLFEAFASSFNFFNSFAWSGLLRSKIGVIILLNIFSNFVRRGSDSIGTDGLSSTIVALGSTFCALGCTIGSLIAFFSNSIFAFSYFCLIVSSSGVNFETFMSAINLFFSLAESESKTVFNPELSFNKSSILVICILVVLSRLGNFNLTFS